MDYFKSEKRKKNKLHTVAKSNVIELDEDQKLSRWCLFFIQLEDNVVIILRSKFVFNYRETSCILILLLTLRDEGTCWSQFKNAQPQQYSNSVHLLPRGNIH